MVLLPEQGQLEDTPFPVLLLDLHRAQFSGWARLTRERASKSFLFCDGVPMFAESNLTSESLGVQLMDAGEISRGDYSRVIERVENDGCKEGKALLELELIEPRGLFVALKDQIRKRLLECFGWSRGSFRIEPGDPPPEETTPFRTEIYGLLQEGIAAYWPSDRILAEFGEHMGKIARRTAQVPRIEPLLNTDEATNAFIDALDGSRNLWQALQSATSQKSLAAAWVLHAFRAIEYDDPDEPAASADEPESGDLEIYFSDLAQETSRAEARLTADADAEGSRNRASERSKSKSTEVLRRNISDKFKRIDELDYYALLGVDQNSDASAFKRAYLGAAKDYHPDALARLHIDDELRDQANTVFAAIGRAYAVLNNADRRREYDASLLGDELGLDGEQIATAETLFRKGEILLRQGNFRGALEFLQPAVDIYPQEADYRNALGWALYKRLPSDPTAARTHLEAALDLASDDASVHFRLSVVLRALGETDEAASRLAKAKQLNPKVR
jgi:tetratricopeptide (TPR) repeat protein